MKIVFKLTINTAIWSLIRDFKEDMKLGDNHADEAEQKGKN